MTPGRVIAGVFVLIAAAVSSACSQLAFLVANVPASFGAYKRATNLAYGEAARQKLDVYTPRKASNRPVVVFWYGGSWTSGNKGDYKFVAAALAERGFVTIVPDYRLAPLVKFPEFMQDGALAVAWAQQHAAEFGGDPKRIVLMGHSAGAHMAALLALNPVFLEQAGAHHNWIRGLIGLSGPYALVPNTEALHTIFSSPFTRADWQPVEFVTSSAPPTLLFHGTDDNLVYISHAEKLRDALQLAGVPVETEFMAHRGHADTVAAFAWAARNRGPVLDHSVKFIERVTSGSAAASARRAQQSSARSSSSSRSSAASRLQPSLAPVSQTDPSRE
jgi:acetyl esterase/lipase